MNTFHSRGFYAPQTLIYPLEPAATLERNPYNLTRLATQMLQARATQVVLALHPKHIEILEVTFLPITVSWLEGCVPVLLETHEITNWLSDYDFAQVELLRSKHGILEVRVLPGH